MFETFNMAAEALLHTTCACLEKNAVDFVVVGGWSPYLRGGGPSMQHPGTRDVDILFADKHRAAVEDSIKAMLGEGFNQSAKHAFQLLMPLNVGGHTFLFNVDFMHPSEQRRDPELLADIFDIGVPDNSDPSGRRWMKSIVFQSAQIVFQRGLFSYFERKGIDVRSARIATNIPLLSEAGLILSKLKSVKQEKRPRDAFDIYYTLSGPNASAAVQSIRNLASEIEEVDEQLKCFLRWIDTTGHVFDFNVRKYTAREFDERPSEFVKRSLL